MKFKKFVNAGDSVSGIFLGISKNEKGTFGLMNSNNEVTEFRLTKGLESLVSMPIGKPITIIYECSIPLKSNPQYSFKKFRIEPLEKPLPLTKCPDCACPETRGSTENCNDCMSGNR